MLSIVLIFILTIISYAQVTGRPVQQAPAILDNELHSISYTLSRNQAVIVEYSHDENTDLFQVKLCVIAPRH